MAINLFTDLINRFLLFSFKFKICNLQRMVEEEELQFHDEYMNEQDPSILHFLLASGDDVCINSYQMCELAAREI